MIRNKLICKNVVMLQNCRIKSIYGTQKVQYVLREKFGFKWSEINFSKSLAKSVFDVS